MDIPKNCGTCAAYRFNERQNGAAHGTCHMYPPGAGGWPRVSLFDSCRQHELRPDLIDQQDGIETDGN